MNSSENRSTTLDQAVKHKLPYSRIKRPLDQLMTIALPLHIQLLNEKSEKIKFLKETNSLTLLHVEQVEASKYIRLLKADMFELEQLNLQIEEKDRDLFYNKIKTPIKEAIETLSKFMELHPDALEPFPDVTNDETLEFPKLICFLDQERKDEEIECSSLPVVSEPLLATKLAFPEWSFLRKELLELHGLIKRFSSLVFTQKESVDCIQNNVEKAHDNVLEGVSHLKKASLLKAASYPFAGAVVGGLLLGPIGAMAGFKIASTAAVIGGALGYKAGATLKKKQEMICDIEMKALSYPCKKKSVSNLELSYTNDEK